MDKNQKNMAEKSNQAKNRVSRTYTDYEIFQGKIRLIEDGRMSVMERDEAIAKAKSAGMNLVQVAYNKNDFPKAVCKILDYSKFKYDQKKQDKANKKAAREARGEEKEICFSIRIDDNDRRTKIEHIREFLGEKNSKVKITIRLRRREMHLLEMAKNMMKGILDEFNGAAALDSKPVLGGNILACTLRSTAGK